MDIAFSFYACHRATPTWAHPLFKEKKREEKNKTKQKEKYSGGEEKQKKRHSSSRERQTNQYVIQDWLAQLVKHWLGMKIWGPFYET